MVDKSLFSSASTEWETPPDLFDQLWEEFGPFHLDPCCRPEHYTARRVVAAGGHIFVPPEEGKPQWRDGSGPDAHGLVHPWHGRVYMNPPYSRQVGKWVEKAVHEVECGNAELVVALLPARTDTRWWQENILGWTDWTGAGKMAEHCALVRFLPGRLKFGGAKNSASCAIVVWRR